MLVLAFFLWLALRALLKPDPSLSNSAARSDRCFALAFLPLAIATPWRPSGGLELPLFGLRRPSFWFLARLPICARASIRRLWYPICEALGHRDS
eukprot:CAMPEP_0119065030 /NCGR_PEP_ID=MMETSP1178-20130426/7949_1 /TAXON_ID=33656 /ORGANISM="unid sp, Strain CCMP2000" /LENGTH=94 /DNA_ID=CAMNT_0007046515 /DNA_START=259 /DNA_END=540 /DNA_ORIENTATION=-